MKRERTPSEADLTAFRASAGSMRDLIDAGTLIEKTDAARGDTLPNVELVADDVAAPLSPVEFFEEAKTRLDVAEVLEQPAHRKR